MVPTLFASWASRLIQIAKRLEGDRVLDVECGTGIVVRIVTAHVGTAGHVTGDDVDPDIVAVSRAVGARQRLATSWREGRAEALPFPDECFDLVSCQFALMF